MINNSGFRLDPCGTPAVARYAADVYPTYSTNFFVRYNCMRVTKFFDNLIAFTLTVK